VNDQRIRELLAAGKTYAQVGELLGMTGSAVRGRARRMKVGSAPTPTTPTTIDEASLQERTRLKKNLDAQLRARALRDVALTDALIEAVREVTPNVPRATIPVLSAPNWEHREQTALLQLSDLHVGAIARVDETGGLGEYNYQIFLQRLARLRDGIRSITAHHRMSHPVRRLVIAELGDLIENVTIFASQGELVDLDLMAQVLAAIEDLSEFVLGMLDTFETISIIAVTGNHGRIGRKGEHKRHISWDYLIPKVMESKLAPYADRISFQVPKAPFAIVDIEGYKFLLRHGDGIQSWAGIPWYGLSRSAGRWVAIQASRGERFDYMLSGHLHQSATVPYTGGEIIVNGSFVGSSTFSVEVMETLSRPEQWFGFVHPRFGLSARYKMQLDDRQ
jgi:hypothetical protein